MYCADGQKKHRRCGSTADQAVQPDMVHNELSVCLRNVSPFSDALNNRFNTRTQVDTS